MEESKDKLVHSFNIVLSDEIQKQLGILQKNIGISITERRNYDSSPHLSILTKFMDEEESQPFIDALVREFQNDSCKEIEFSSFSPSDTNTYLFLNPSEKSRKYLFSLHDRALKVTKKIGSEGYRKSTPEHPYTPHISIIKLLPEEMKHVLTHIPKDFNGLKMNISKYNIARGKILESGYTEFPILSEIPLNPKK